MIDQRVAALERQIDVQRSSGGANSASTGSGNGGRGQLVVQFFEKRRRKAWLSRGDEEVCWECWTIKVTVAEPRTESGMGPPSRYRKKKKNPKKTKGIANTWFRTC
ncbi:hypothetical protein FVER14953_08253 [Fusarium verticillioides]|nr:hypothetical protein FVER14953_08253 [Fusarium verticillioides]